VALRARLAGLRWPPFRNDLDRVLAWRKRRDPVEADDSRLHPVSRGEVGQKPSCHLASFGETGQPLSRARPRCCWWSFVSWQADKCGSKSNSRHCIPSAWWNATFALRDLSREKFSAKQFELNIPLKRAMCVSAGRRKLADAELDSFPHGPEF
jgi:hypothetical protein